jgi:hypothetical protein
MEMCMDRAKESDYTRYMKHFVLTVCIASLVSGCSEKTKASFEVFKQRAENQLVAAAGEAEVATELYRNQYAALKERLVRLKTTQHMLNDRLDEAYASNNQKLINVIEPTLRDINAKVPEAEKTLKEFFDIYQNQRVELQHLKEEIAIYKSAGSLSDTLSVTSDYEQRAESIKQLTDSLKKKAKRAQALLEVGKFEETYTTR